MSRTRPPLGGASRRRPASRPAVVAVAAALIAAAAPVAASSPTAALPAATASADPATAEEAAALPLARAIAIALENSHLLTAADAARGAAAAEHRRAGAARLPQVTVEEIASRTTNPAMVFGNLLGQEEFGAENFAIDLLNEPDPLTNFQTRLSVFQPLWTGGRIQRGREAARDRRDAADAGLQRTRQQVVHQVVDAYSGVLLAAAHREVAQDTLKTARAHVKLVQDLRDGGLVVASDLLQAQVRESEVVEMTLVAERGLAVARAALNLAMGRDPARPLPPLEDPPLEDTSPPDDTDALIAEALAARPDLAAAAASARAAERRAEAARGGRRPEVGLLGRLEANDADLPGADGTNWTLMATLRWSVFDGGAARAQVLRAREEARRAGAMQELLRQQVALQVIEAVHTLGAARGRRESAERAIRHGREALRIVEDRYREGLATLVELLEAETALTRSRAREVEARRDLLLARTTLDLAVGRL